MSEPTTVIVTERKPKWSWWRDLIILSLAIAVVAMTFVLVRQGAAATEERAAQSAQISALSTELDMLRAQRATDQATIKALAADNRRLVALLEQAGIDPGPTVQPIAAPVPTVTPSPRLTVVPVPVPGPVVTVPSTPTPTPTAAPTPTTSPRAGVLDPLTGLTCPLGLLC